MSVSRELVFEQVCDQTRLAVLEDGKLCEIYYARGKRGKLAGNIYAGRVQNILPGMNAAFVDIGLGRNGFLYAGDICIDTKEQQELHAQLESRRIEKMLRQGQMIVVQVTKEPGGSKGPRLSESLSLPGRLTVLLPTIRYAGVSRKITDESERDRLYHFADAMCREYGAGVIVRTAAEHVDETSLKEDYLYSLSEWRRMEGEARHSSKPRLIQPDGDLMLYAVREMFDEHVQQIRTDSEEIYGRLLKYSNAITPALSARISLVRTQHPLFDLLRVDHQLESAFERRVNLKSGGTLVIDETEAMTVIDVNTARFTGNKSPEETIFRLNCEAADEIARQLRLRDVGGIIVIDFIDMKAQEQREALLERLREALQNDQNRSCVLGMTRLGLVEMTRKKLRQSLSKLLQRDCARCAGSGKYFTYETEAYNALRELQRRRRMGDETAYKLEACDQIAEWIERIGIPDANTRVLRSSTCKNYAFLPVDRAVNDENEEQA